PVRKNCTQKAHRVDRHPPENATSCTEPGRCALRKARLRAPTDNRPSDTAMTAECPIVDAHQHFWDPRINYHPWLCDEPPIPFRYGDYSALRKPYLPADYRRDTRGFDIAGTVYVEAEWSHGAAVAELDYIAGLRRASGL